MSHDFTLPAELTIYSAAETRGALLGWLAGHGGEPTEPLTLAAHGVEEVDGAGLQLLCALSLSLERKHWAWQLVAPSAAFTTACRSLGLTEWLAQHLAAEAA
jgi:anti-anti-sigma regulatory factor